MERHPICTTVATNLRTVRSTLRISPETLARRIAALGGNVNNRAIRRAEEGMPLKVDQMAWIAQALGTDIDRLLEDVPDAG